MFLKNAENMGLLDIALAALWVAGSSPYSLANCSWYLFWYTKSRNFLTPACWMIGISAGWPPTMPIFPWANSAQTSLRSVVPGLGWVSPDFTSWVRNCRACMFAVLLIA